MAIGIMNATPTVAVTDLDAARKFYGSILEFEEEDAGPASEESIVYRVGNTHLYVYRRPTPAGSAATVCAFTVRDVEQTVATLRRKGVRFEEYDIPEMNLRTVNGIAQLDGMKTAWFRDPSGNILALDDSENLVDRRSGSAHAGAPA